MVLGPKQEPFSTWGKNAGAATPDLSSSSVHLVNNEMFSVQKRINFLFEDQSCACVAIDAFLELWSQRISSDFDAGN